jgi:uncharacterized membrane protein YfhO
MLEEQPALAATEQGTRTATTATGESASGAASAAGRVRIISRTPNWITVQAEMREAGWVVLLDRWDPGWRATIDGHATAVLVANHMFRAVPAGSGTHQIEFTYHPSGLLLGAVISAVTLLALIMVWWHSGRKARTASKPASDSAHRLR